MRDFAYFHGAKGEKYGVSGRPIEVDGKFYTFIVTAWELAKVSNNSRLCSMASFYEYGTVIIDNPNPKLKDEICNWNLLSSPIV